jgi:hypothetical protein
MADGVPTMCVQLVAPQSYAEVNPGGERYTWIAAP